MRRQAVQFFIKRLTANELGQTGAHTRGEIYVPLSCREFFPAPSGPRVPFQPSKASVTVQWTENGTSRNATIQLTVYKKKEAHLHSIPAGALGAAVPGDILRIERVGDVFHLAVLDSGSQVHSIASNILGKDAAAISDAAGLSDVQGPPDERQHVEFWHPLLDGPPRWASGWGEDEDFGPFVEIKVGDVRQRLRWIPPGTFRMGSPEREPGRINREGPQHVVQLDKGFWLFDTPVTQELYQVVMGTNPSCFVSPKRPVETVSWHDAQEFATRLGEVIPGLGLPTEAEWEYACRAGTSEALYCGPIEIVGERNAPALDSIAWYGGNCGVEFDLEHGENTDAWPEKQYSFSKGGTREVGQKAANAWGLYDMLGNVYEWCVDPPRDYSASSIVDPVGTEASAGRVMRGGSWHSRTQFLRAAYRLWRKPGNRSMYLGFRCRVREIEGG